MERLVRWMNGERHEAAQRALRLIETDASQDSDWLGRIQWLIKLHRYLAEIDRLANEPKWFAWLFGLLIGPIMLGLARKAWPQLPTSLTLTFYVSVASFLLLWWGVQSLARLRQRRLEGQVVSMICSDPSLANHLRKLGIYCPIWEPKINQLIRVADKHRAALLQQKPAQPPSF